MPRAISDGFRIDLDLDHARREADRVRDMLQALRRRHDLSRYEYTRVVRVVPGSDTFSHPILTLGNRFADSEDLLLSTYLHEQMHWYLWHLGTPDSDPVAAFMDELVRRYPEAPTELPDGARNYESTYLHLVINWLEVAATGEFIGRVRACAVLALSAEPFHELQPAIPASNPPSVTRLLLGGTTLTSSTYTSKPGSVPSRKIATSVTSHPAGIARLPES